MKQPYARCASGHYYSGQTCRSTPAMIAILLLIASGLQAQARHTPPSVERQYGQSYWDCKIELEHHNYAAAEDGCLKALAITTGFPTERYRAKVDTLDLLSKVYMAQRMTAKAIPLLQAELAILKSRPMLDEKAIGVSSATLAMCYQAEHRNVEAATQYKNAILIFERLDRSTSNANEKKIYEKDLAVTNAAYNLLRQQTGQQ
jgi:hypothetical protein